MMQQFSHSADQPRVAIGFNDSNVAVELCNVRAEVVDEVNPIIVGLLGNNCRCQHGDVAVCIASFSGEHGARPFWA